MSFTERPSPPVANPAESERGAAAAPAPQEDATVGQDDAQQNDSPQNGAVLGRSEAAAEHGNGQGSRAPSDGQLPPDGKADDPVAALWGADLVEGYRTRWQTLQLGFVDDPQAATREAAQLVDEAVQSLTGALGDQKHSLDGWQSQTPGDTEVLRTALQSYREFLDRLLGM